MASGRKERELALQAPELADTVGGTVLNRPRLHWWREVLTLAIFYELYSLARNSQGSGSTSPTHAFRNARVVINFERAIGLYHEESVQRLFLDARPVVMALNVYYGTAHFLVTAGVLMWMFLRHPDRYARWRWALACTTLLALVGFLAFPLMPPRLITSAFGMGSYVDTLHTVGGLWNFEDGAIAKLSNQYAAMPSLHFAWSLWCCLALWPRLRSGWGRALAVAHPSITLVAIVATANHYWLDAVGGAFTLLLGWLLGGLLAARASRVTTWPRMPRLRSSRSAGSVTTPATPTAPGELEAQGSSGPDGRGAPAPIGPTRHGASAPGDPVGPQAPVPDDPLGPGRHAPGGASWDEAHASGGQPEREAPGPSGTTRHRARAGGRNPETGTAPPTGQPERVAQQPGGVTDPGAPDHLRRARTPDAAGDAPGAAVGSKGRGSRS